MANKDDKFLLVDKMDEMKPIEKKKIHIDFNTRLIVYGLLIFVFSICTFVSYFSLYLSCADRVVTYNEESNATYNVCLDQNNVYTDECLKEGMEYLSVLTNRVNTRFMYHADFSTDVEYDLEYKVTAVTKIYSGEDKKILYEKEEEIVSPKRIAETSKEININQIVELDYKKYADLVSNYINTYAEGADASVDLNFYLIEPTETRKLSSLNIPLVGQTFDISKEIISYKDMKVNLKNNYWNDVNSVYGVVGTACLLILTFFIFRLTKLLVVVNGNKSKYEVELYKILKENDNYIVMTKDGYVIDENKTILKVSSFKELLDARNTLNKPIIYTKINNVKSEFVVEDESVVYKYVMKEADFQ